MCRIDPKASSVSSQLSDELLRAHGKGHNTTTADHHADNDLGDIVAIAVAKQHPMKRPDAPAPEPQQRPSATISPKKRPEPLRLSPMWNEDNGEEEPQKPRSRRSILTPAQEAANRKEVWLARMQKECTLDYATTKDREIAAKILLSEAHRRQVLQRKATIKMKSSGAPQKFSVAGYRAHVQMTAPRASQVRPVFDLLDRHKARGVAADLVILMNEGKCRRPRCKGHEAADRTQKDNYIFVQSELSMLRLWK